MTDPLRFPPSHLMCYRDPCNIKSTCRIDSCSSICWTLRDDKLQPASCILYNPQTASNVTPDPMVAGHLLHVSWQRPRCPLSPLFFFFFFFNFSLSAPEITSESFTKRPMNLNL